LPDQPELEFTDICLYRNTPHAITERSQLVNILSGRIITLNINKDETVSNMRSFENKLFIGSNGNDYKSRLHMLDEKLSVVSTVHFKLAITGINNMAITHTKNIGIVWANLVNAHIAIAIFNNRRMVLVASSLRNKDTPGSNYYLHVVSADSVLVCNDRDNMRIYKLELNMQ